MDRRERWGFAFDDRFVSAQGTAIYSGAGLLSGITILFQNLRRQWIDLRFGTTTFLLHFLPPFCFFYIELRTPYEKVSRTPFDKTFHFQ
jgi:hypothetical protein